MRSRKAGGSNAGVAEFERLKREVVEPGWIREMREYFARTGTFRSEDLRRLLGDPAKGVETGARNSVAKHFCS
ncbi:MAG: hypothetical protein ABIF82_12095 [Planctomycetota bacterium]